MKTRPSESDVAVFICHRGLWLKGIILGRWFWPRYISSAHLFEAAIRDLFKAGGQTPHKSRGKLNSGYSWVVDESNCMEHDLVRRSSLEEILTHSRACLDYGLPTVRAYREAIGKWPSSADLKARLIKHHTFVLPWINKYLRRRGGLRGRRGLLKTPEGRHWLVGEASRVLGRTFKVHIEPGGEVWLFTREPTGAKSPRHQRR